MATRTCPSCGTQYLATVRRCIDCDAALVDDISGVSAAQEVASEPADPNQMVHLALANWGNQLKVTLEGMLDRQGIPRSWEAGDLVVPASRRNEVGTLIAAVEGSDANELDESQTMVALEIEGLDAAGMEVLDGRLLATSIAHAWSDDGELLVAETDEEQVLTLIQEVFDQEHQEVTFDAAEVLSELYIATDRLTKRVGDPKAETAFVKSAERIEGIEVPYGLDGELWKSIIGDTAVVTGSLTTPESKELGDEEAQDGEAKDHKIDPKDLVEQLKSLRERLRELV